MTDKTFVLPAIRKAVMQQSSEGAALPTPWWFTTINPQRLVVTESSEGNIIHPIIEQQVFAANMAEMLNKEIPHDGTWVVAFSMPGEISDAAGALVTRYYSRWYMLWFDKDSDLHFLVDNIEPFAITLSVGCDHYLNAAERAYGQYLEQLSEYELSQNQMRKAALGEIQTQGRA